MIDNVSASNHSFQYLLISFWNVTVVRYLGLLTICSRIHRSIDSDLHGQKGEIEIFSCEGENSLLLHGPLRAAESGSYLEHVDGTPFFWLGDTWWYGLIGEFRWPEEFRTATADRVAKGFNVIRLLQDSFQECQWGTSVVATRLGCPGKSSMPESILDSLIWWICELTTWYVIKLFHALWGHGVTIFLIWG